MKLSKWSLWPIGPHTWTLITLWYYFRFIYLSIYFLMYVQVASQRFVLLGAAEQPISGMTDVADILKKGNYQIFFSFNCCFYVFFFIFIYILTYIEICYFFWIAFLAWLIIYLSVSFSLILSFVFIFVSLILLLQSDFYFIYLFIYPYANFLTFCCQRSQSIIINYIYYDIICIIFCYFSFILSICLSIYLCISLRISSEKEGSNSNEWQVCRLFFLILHFSSYKIVLTIWFYCLFLFINLSSFFVYLHIK